MKQLDVLSVGLDGVQLVEASAGTGKTHTITTLVLRLLLEKRLRLGQVLVVTFTHAATSELRERLRSRIEAAARAFEGQSSAASDPGLSALVAASQDREADGRWLRLALGALDEASVYTIHGLCQRVLSEHAFESGAEFESELISDGEALLDEAADDAWAVELHELCEAQVEFLTGRGLGLARVTSVCRAAARSQSPLLVPPPSPEPDIEQALRGYLEVRRRALACWSGREQQVRDLLLESPALHRNRYRPDSVLRWLGQLRALLHEDSASLRGWFPECTKLGARALALSTKGEQDPPEHPLFDLVDELTDQVAVVEQALETWWLGALRRAVAGAQQRFRERKERAAVQTFDDLLTRTAEALRSERGAALASVMRQRWSAALIDEFQDTDPVQYEIFRRVFASQGSTLFMIGDPKQAIYAFRGADVFAYLDAARDGATASFTLTTNYRSDPGIIDAVNVLFGGPERPFLLDEISYRPVTPRPGASDQVTLPGISASLDILWVPSEGRAGAAGKITKARWARPELPSLVAREVARIMNSGATLGDRALRAGDLAVLTRTNEQAYSMQQALRRAGLRCVLSGDRSVVESEEAVEVAFVLRALAEPSRPRALRAALVTSLFGLDAEALDALREDAPGWDEWVQRFSHLSLLATNHGVARAFRELLEGSGAGARLATQPGGERKLTNVRHLVELLQQAAHERRLPPAGLVRWLDRVRHDQQARRQLDESTAQLRLESDEDAVRITTVHRSKGLEFPWVICPYLWDSGPGRNRRAAPLLYHDPADGRRLKLELRSPARSIEAREALEIARNEALAEELRLLYVALTRARHRVTLLWGRFTAWQHGAMAYLLHPSAFQTRAGAEEAELLEDLGRLEIASQGTIRVVSASDVDCRVTHPVLTAELAARRFDRHLSSSWSVSSFSALASTAKPGKEDEWEASLDDESDEPLIPLTEMPSILGTIAPAYQRLSPGAQTGQMLHSVLEQVDFCRQDRAELPRIVEQELKRNGLFDPELVPLLARALSQTLEAPLRPNSRLALSSVPSAQRISEMEFTLPACLGTGSDWASCREPITPALLGQAFRECCGPNFEPTYAARLQRLDFEPLRGFLRGYVDLVFRFEGRWYVVDYKSNHLGGDIEDYAAPRLAQVMADHHYLLQYHLYTVALHRMLQSKEPDYDYESQFGGVLYLFLRGLVPEHAPAHGVYFDRPPLRLIERLSDLFGPVVRPGARLEGEEP